LGELKALRPNSNKYVIASEAKQSLPVQKDYSRSHSKRKKELMAKRRTKKKQNNNRILLIVFGVIVIGAIGAVIAFQSPGAGTAATLSPEVSVQQAFEMQQNGALLLDVRELYEWEEIHADGAVLLPLSELQSRLDELPKDQEIAIICRSGNRSAQARDILLNAGFETVTSVGGGMNAWAAAELPVVLGP
jgi:rhodanese-related sulfurtransferase